MSRHAILNALQEELKSLEEENAMEPADGSGVQSREVQKDKEPSKVEKKKGFKLAGGGQTVGGEAGGVKESIKEEQAIDKADGSSVETPDTKEADCCDDGGAPSNSGAPEGSEKDAIEKAKGSSVASPKPKDTDGVSAGGTNAKAIDKASGSAVADSGVSEQVIELPHDTLVEDSEGNQKTLAKGTKIVIGNVEMKEEMKDQNNIESIVAAAVMALNGAGEYDYGLEGKEIQMESLLEDTKKLMEGKPWEDDEDPHAAALGRKSDDEQDTAGPEDDEDPHAVALANKKGKKIKEAGTYCEEDEGGELEEIEDEEHEEYEEKFEDADIDVTDPGAIAGIIADIDDDLAALKVEIGVDDEVGMGGFEGEAEFDDEEGEMNFDDEEDEGFEGDDELGDEDDLNF